MPTRRVLNGIHVSNHPDTHIEQMMQATRPAGASVVLHQLMLPGDSMLGEVGGDADNYNWLPLRYGRRRDVQGGWDAPPAPERLIIVRVWNGNDPFQFDPRRRAEYIVRRLERWTASSYPAHNLVDDPCVAIQATNEANIEPSSQLGLPPTARYDRIAAWESAFWDAFDRAAPGRRCLSCGPNLAAGHDWLPNQPDSEYEHPGIRELCRRHIETGGLLGVHVYFHGHRPWERGGPGEANEYWFWARPFRPEGWRDRTEPSLPHDKGGVVARFPDARFAVTEAGTFLHHEPSATETTVVAMEALLDRCRASGRFVAVCPFIWDTDPTAHPQNRIAGNPSLRAALAGLADVGAPSLPTARPGWTAPEPEPEAVAPDMEPRGTVDGLTWPVGATELSRAGRDVPAGWYVALGFAEEYVLSGRPAVHPGLDLNLRAGGDSDLGAPVYAAADGVVVASGHWPVWGHIVLLKHRLADGRAIWTQYAHLRERRVAAGAQVSRGTIVGTIGKGEGDRYSAHLHFEVRTTDLAADYWPGADASAVRSRYVDPAGLMGVASPAVDPSAELLAWAAGMQAIRPNAGAALYRALRADGFYPISEEGDVGEYRAQLARGLETSVERVYYARRGEWDRVRWVERR